jgi:hypothetical protein
LLTGGKLINNKYSKYFITLALEINSKFGEFMTQSLWRGSSAATW